MPARWLLGASLALLLAACQATASPTPAPATPAPTAVPTATPAPSAEPSSPAADAVIVTVDVTGGECREGPCGATYVIHGDGTVEGPDGGPTAIPADAAARIVSLAAATDWDAVRAVPFTGECPVNFDGQKHVYTFPADTGELVFDACEFDLSGVEVFQAIDEALFGG